MNFKTMLLVTAGGAFMTAMPAAAAILAGPTIGGFSTFTDSNTGYHWVRLDTFFNVSSDYMVAAVSPAGFAFADRDAVEDLLGSLPLGGGEWPGYASVMGSAPNRALIWGSYGPADPSGNVGWAYAFDGEPGWSYADGVVLGNIVPNEGTDAADMNIWTYATDVPEPASWAMMVAGLGLVGGAMRRRMTVTA